MHNNPINGIDPTGMEFSLIGTLKAVAIGAVIMGLLGSVIGGSIGAYFHIVQNQTFEGIWNSIGLGALYGALVGAILGGLAAISAKALAVGLAINFGVNSYFTVKILRDPTMRPETKAAAVLFLILQAVLSFRAIIKGFSPSSGGEPTPAPASAIKASLHDSAGNLKPDTAYLGYIEPSGKVGFVPASRAMPGHIDAMRAGLIPKGSQGFSVVTNGRGEIGAVLGRSQLNGGDFALPQSTWSAILSGFKEAGVKFMEGAGIEN